MKMLLLFTIIFPKININVVNSRVPRRISKAVLCNNCFENSLETFSKASELTSKENISRLSFGLSVSGTIDLLIKFSPKWKYIIKKTRNC